MYQDVKDFHFKFELPAPHRPRLLPPEQLAFRLTYMMEELGEFGAAHRKHLIADAADALADLTYFALGTAVQMGLPFEQVWAMVHEANMRKAAGLDKYGNKLGVVKPIGWLSPHATIVQLLFNEMSKP